MDEDDLTDSAFSALHYPLVVRSEFHLSNFQKPQLDPFALEDRVALGSFALR